MALDLLRMGMATGMAPVMRTRRRMWRPYLQLWCQLPDIRNTGLAGIAVGEARAYGLNEAFRSIG